MDGLLKRHFPGQRKVVSALLSLQRTVSVMAEQENIPAPACPKLNIPACLKPDAFALFAACLEGFQQACAVAVPASEKVQRA